MNFHSFETLYDVLDLKPDASPQEIREAYIKSKSAYTKDSLALYTLISPEEREDMLRMIERAYETLSNPDRRREYDQNHNAIDPMGVALDARVAPVVSIDRVPPMETSMDPDALLVPPSTAIITPPPLPSRAMQSQTPNSGVTFFTTGDVPSRSSPSGRAPENDIPQAPPPQPSWESIVGSAPDEWSGAMIRTLREARKLSLEELSSATKISKTYLTAIEEELFAKLPAPVFVRGFVTQVAKTLKLPAETVAASYMNRYHLSGVHHKN